MKPDFNPDQQTPVREPLCLPRFAERVRSRPFVVALEGPNGAGKTTLSRLLAKQFAAPTCMGTDAAWLSDAFRIRMIRDAEWFVSAMFFWSGCFEQMRMWRDRPNPLVIMDRSLWSTLAVHSAERPERLEALLDMLRPIAGQIQLPDLTLVLEASYETCQSRIAQKSGAARVLDDLTANRTFHSRERDFYHWLAGQRAEVLFLDVNQSSPEAVAERAAAVISEKAGVRRPVATVVDSGSKISSSAA
jgi:thymidylate kinase